MGLKFGRLPQKSGELAALKLMSYLPGRETRCTQQVSTWLNTNVFVILGTDLTQLERRAHLTVQLILFLGHSDVIFWCVVYQETQICWHV